MPHTCHQCEHKECHIFTAYKSPCQKISVIQSYKNLDFSKIDGAFEPMKNFFIFVNNKNSVVNRMKIHIGQQFF